MESKILIKGPAFRSDPLHIVGKRRQWMTFPQALLSSSPKVGFKAVDWLKRSAPDTQTGRRQTRALET